MFEFLLLRGAQVVHEHHRADLFFASQLKAVLRTMVRDHARALTAPKQCRGFFQYGGFLHNIFRIRCAAAALRARR